MTTTVVARALGVTPATITRWELGLRDPAGTHLADYLSLLDRLAREVANSGGDA